MKEMQDVRAAQRTDRADVLRLAQAFATSFEVEPEAFDAAFDLVIAKEDAALLVVEEGPVVVGYVLGFIHPTLFANGPVAWVEELMVAEDRRRKGHGRTLTSAFEFWARAQGAVPSLPILLETLGPV